MSRTHRYIPYWARKKPNNSELTCIGIGNYYYHYPIRCALVNGRDNGKGQSYYKTSNKGNLYKEPYIKKTRKFFKRQVNKQYRRDAKLKLKNFHY